MTVLSFHFKILTILGIWCPSEWPFLSKIIYKFYSTFVVAALFSICSFQLANLVLECNDFNSFNDTFFVMLSLTMAGFKSLCYLICQEKITNLLEMFEETCCIAQDEFETNVREKHEKFCRRAAIYILVFLQIVVVGFTLIPLFSNSDTHELPYKVFLPYDIANTVIYCLTYFHHAFVAIYSASITITSDLIVTGFMLHLCGQHHILKHRLQQLPSQVIEADASETAFIEKQLLKENVQHHVHIYDIAKAIAMTFSVITIGQFYVDALEICLSVYQLSTRTNNFLEAITYFMYIVILLGQLFFMCYFGNEVALQSKSLSSIMFGIDWTPLSVDFRKNLTIMILRSSKPIKIATGAFVRLSLESFVKVLKTSYSGFNVLNSSAQ